MLAVSILSGPATAQAGLDARLAEAEQKLDSDVQSCRPVNPAEFADLLNEAMANKQRAAKAAKKGVPINQAQVDADLGKAAMLFARALTAQALQCIQAAAQQHAQVTHEQLEQLPVGHRPADLVASCPTDTVPTITSQAAAGAGAMAVSLTCAAPADKGMVEIYRTHNAVRAEYGAPPLVRDPALELGAGQYVGELLRVGRPVHASRTGRGNIRENISQGLPGWSPGQLLQAWVRERANFVPGTFPNVSRTHNWYDVGHWAQMLWVRTVLIGCARAAGISASFLVCRYGPGGNRDGEQVGIPVPPRPYSVEAPPLPPAEVFRPGSPPASTPTPTDTYAGTFDTDNLKAMIEAYNTAVNAYDAALAKCDKQEMQRTAEIIETVGPQLKAISEATKETGKLSKYSSVFADLSIAIVDEKLQEIADAKAKVAAPPKPAPPPPPPLPPLPDTKIPPPDLPQKEVYNPADRPTCPLEIM